MLGSFEQNRMILRKRQKAGIYRSHGPQLFNRDIPFAPLTAALLFLSFAGGAGSVCTNDETAVTSPFRQAWARRTRPLSAGDHHHCVIQLGEAIPWCWGTDGLRQYSTPSQPFSDNSPFLTIQSGSYATCALSTSGKGACWVSHSYGKESLTLPSHPTPWAFLAVHGSAVCAVDVEYRATCWDYLYPGNEVVVIPSETVNCWIYIDVGPFHTCGIHCSGRAECWGRNDNDQCDVPSEHTWIDITVGRYHTCGITASHKTVCWGNADQSQLDIPFDNDQGWVGVSAGAYHTCGVLSGGAILCWGFWPSLGKNDAPDPQMLWQYIDCQESTCCALGAGKNEIFCWGELGAEVWRKEKAIWPQVAVHNTQACLLGYTSSSCVEFHGAVPPYGDKLAISLGSGNECSLFKDLSIACNSLTGVPTSGQWLAIASGNAFACGIKEDLSAHCWGGTKGSALHGRVPATRWVSIGTGDSHVCGVTVSGGVHCWDSTGPLLLPQSTSERWRSVAAGGNAACALSIQSILRCWKVTTQQVLSTPRLVDSRWASVSVASANQFCGVTTLGKVLCWESGVQRLYVPQAVSQAVAVEVGEILACAFSLTSVKVCWDPRDPTYSVLTKLVGQGGELSVAPTFYCEESTDNILRCVGESSFYPNTINTALQQTCVGSDFVCGLGTDGKLACWEPSGYSLSSSTYTQIECGYSHRCGRRATMPRRISCSGLQPSSLDTNPASFYVKSTLTTNEWDDISTGYDFLCGLDSLDTVTCVGYLEFAPSRDWRSLFTVSPSSRYACGETNDGDIVCWTRKNVMVRPGDPHPIESVTLELPTFIRFIPFSTSSLNRLCLLPVDRRRIICGSLSVSAGFTADSELFMPHGAPIEYFSVQGDVSSEVVSLCASNYAAEVFCLIGEILPPDPYHVGATCVTKRLKHLLLSHSGLDGQFPYMLGAFSLQTLDFESNAMTGDPQLTSLSPSLTALRLSDNHGAFSLQGLSGLSLLQEVVLNGNDVLGDVLTLGALLNLKHLALSNTLVSGNLDSLSTITGLTYLEANSARFASQFPIEVSQLSNLVSLSLSKNSFTGSLPSTWSTSMQQLTYLSLDHNQLQGYFPLPPSVVTANLSENSFSEWECTNSPVVSALQSLHVSRNSLIELDMACLFGMIHLTTFEIFSNPLTAIVRTELPNHLHLAPSKLQALHLSNFPMPVIDELAFSPFHSLTLLNLRGNNLQYLPQISSLSKLKMLDVSNNSLPSCTLPSAPSLEWIDLSSNDLTSLVSMANCQNPDNIPDASVFASIPLLTSINISNNAISHIDPRSFEGAKKLFKQFTASNSGLSSIAAEAWDIVKQSERIDFHSSSVTDIFPCLDPDQVSACYGVFPNADTVVCLPLQDGEYCGQGGPALCPSGFRCANGVVESCPPHTFSHQGSFACEVCANGTYNNFAEAEACIMCEEGYRCVEGRRHKCPSFTYSNAGADRCVPCSPGEYSDEGAASCKLCPAGYSCNFGRRLGCSAGFFSAEGAANCTLCAPGKYSNALSSGCISCEGGYACNDGDRAPCPPMTYAEPKSAVCETCPTGYYSRGLAASCIECEPGYACNTTHRVPCQAGRYASGGASTCQPCPEGSWSDARAGECTPCPSGEYCVNGTRRGCEAGRYAAAASAECEVCPEGTYSQALASTCLVCEEGYSCTMGSRKACPAGTFAPEGVSVCERCPNGTYSFSRSSECYDCSAGFYCVDGLSNACPEHTFSPEKASTCTLCPQGRYALSEGSSSCRVCEAGHRCVSGTIAACPAWTFSEPGSDTCTPCPAGSYSGAMSLRCTTCEAGYACGNNTRAECPAHYYAPAGSSKCTLCPAGTYALSAGAKDCDVCEGGYACNDGDRAPCPPMTYAEPESAVCETCPTGYYSRGLAASCIECEPGYACNTTHRVPCQAGRYASGGASACQPCPEGSWSDARAGECTPCPAGEYCVNGTRRGCEAGRYAAAASAECEVCPEGTYSQALASTCLVCEEGYSCTMGSRKACPAGTFAPEGVSVCERCPNGTYSFPRSSECYDCSAGFYCVDGLSNACPEHTFSPEKASTCTLCPQGRYALSEGSSSCRVCEAGHRCVSGTIAACPAWTFSEPGSDTCTPCPAGSYSGAMSLRCTTCEAGYACGNNTRAECPAHYYAPAGSSKCTLCPAGTYALSAGAKDCDVCEGGYACDEGRRVLCPQHTYATEGSAKCTPCPSGWYSESSGSTTCKACSPGYMCPDHDPLPCEPTTYSSLPAQLECKVCEPGRYASSSGSKACAACEGGHACISGTKLPCPAQTYAPSGSAECKPCPPGQFSGAKSVLCTSCGYGSIMQINSSTSEAFCASCGPGRYFVQNINEDRASCEICEPGFFCTGGAEPRTACPVGTFAQGEGNIACSPCPPGTAANTSLNAPSSSMETVCYPCPTGRYSTAEASVACTLCPDGTHGIALQGAQLPTSLSVGCASCNTTFELCGPGVSVPLSRTSFQDELGNEMPMSASALDNAQVPVVVARTEHKETGLLAEESWQLFGFSLAVSVYIVAGIMAAAALLLSSVLQRQCKNCLVRLDLYSLDHPLQPGDMVQNRPSFLGGAISIAVLIIGLAILANAVLDYFSPENRSSTSSMIPWAELGAISTPLFQFDVRAMFARIGTQDCSASHCKDFTVTADDPTLPMPSCWSYNSSNLCVCRCTYMVPSYSIPGAVGFRTEVSSDLASLAWTMSAEGGGPFEYFLSSFSTLRTPLGVPEAWAIEFEALAESYHDTVHETSATGYMLFPYSSSYRGELRTSLTDSSTTTVTWSGSVGSLGKETHISLRITPLQALSAAVGLLLGAMGGFRVFFKVAAKLKRSKADKSQLRGRGESSKRRHPIHHASAFKSTPNASTIVIQNPLQSARQLQRK